MRRSDPDAGGREMDPNPLDRSRYDGTSKHCVRLRSKNACDLWVGFFQPSEKYTRKRTEVINCTAGIRLIITN